MKRLITTFLSVFILASFIVSGINLSVHTHVCKKDGVSYSLFSSFDHGCKKEKDILTRATTSCCSSKVKKINTDYTFESEECCTDNLFVIEIDSDINTLNHENKIDIQSQSLSYLIDQDLFFQEKSPINKNKAPPFLHRKTYLAKIQTYII